MNDKRKALGRGLEQLFNNENLDVAKLEQTIYETATNEEIIDIELSELRPNPYQPRKGGEPCLYVQFRHQRIKGFAGGRTRGD